MTQLLQRRTFKEKENKMTSNEQQQVLLKQENYGFPIADEDDFHDADERNRVIQTFKQQREFTTAKIDSQRKRWENVISKKNLKSKLQAMDFHEVVAARDENKELKKLTRKGIPPELRGEIWFLLSGAYARMKEQKAKQNEYSVLLARYKEQKTDNTRQIDADIDRTFPHNPYFNNKAVQDSLRNVLYTYSFYNTGIGYCQSMNFVAAILLLHMSEERAFWTLDVMLRDYLPNDLYDVTMNGLKCEVHVLSDLTMERAPKIAKHLQKLDVNFLLFTTQWFLCLFLTCLPFETVFRIWDAFFLEGYKILFRVSISLLNLMEKEILACTNMGEVLKLLTNQPRELFDCRTLMKSSFKIRRFSRAKIEKARKQFRATLNKQ